MRNKYLIQRLVCTYWHFALICFYTGCFPLGLFFFFSSLCPSTWLWVVACEGWWQHGWFGISWCRTYCSSVSWTIVFTFCLLEVVFCRRVLMYCFTPVHLKCPQIWCPVPNPSPEHKSVNIVVLTHIRMPTKWNKVCFGLVEVLQTAWHRYNYNERASRCSDRCRFYVAPDCFRPTTICWGQRKC